MPKYAESFLLDLGRVEKFEIVSVNETVTVKGLTFAMYKQEKNLLSTEEIIEIRKKYGLSLQSFAKVLGIEYSELSKIENGVIQSSEHDALLRLANNSYGFYKLRKEKTKWITN